VDEERLLDPPIGSVLLAVRWEADMLAATPKQGRAAPTELVSQIANLAPLERVGRQHSAPAGMLPCSLREQGGVSLRFASLRALHCGHTREDADVIRRPEPPGFRQQQVRRSRSQ
jgi:hypothetical protein